MLSYGSYFRLGLQRAEELKMYLKTAKALGAPIMRIWGGTRSGAMCGKEETALLLSQAKQAAAIAGEYGIVLGWSATTPPSRTIMPLHAAFLKAWTARFLRHTGSRTASGTLPTTWKH